LGEVARGSGSTETVVECAAGGSAGVPLDAFVAATSGRGTLGAVTTESAAFGAAVVLTTGGAGDATGVAP
jgi:hypothetical protein